MAFIVAARRTAVCPRGGAFAALSIEDLGVPVVRACLADAGLATVDEVIVANALGAGGNPARRVALAAGLEDVAGLTVDRQCAGGLDAILLAGAMVDAGQAQAVLAGGVESYSRRPQRSMDGVPYDQAPFTPWPDRDPDMAQAAADLAGASGITRAAQDAWAVASHARAQHGAEIVPVAGQTRDAFTRDLTMALAARAKPITGSITAANAAVAADAAAFCVVVSDAMATRFPHAMRIVAGVTLGADPTQPGTAPIPAIARVLARAGLTPQDLTQSEIMEAYAVQAIACVQGAGLDPATVNMRGGALARGHPIGASGTILAVRLFHDLTQGYGLAAIASAGGIGSAVVFSRSGA
jgi:acetyl-CoA C-acetyltransferase